MVWWGLLMFSKVESIIITSSLILTVGCSNKVNFAGTDASEGFASIEVPNTVTEPPPVTTTPPPEMPLPVVPQLELKAGTCPLQGEQILSCLNCRSTAATPAPPILSRKAQELLTIMTAACSIRNASDPAGYVTPTREQLLHRLIQCSPTAYPDTAFVNTQELTIRELTTNPVAQNAAFSGLYYTIISPDFESYFGLEVSEARYSFCRGEPAIRSGGIYPIEYYNALYSDQSYTLPPVWVAAQRIREDLRNCMARSLSNPNVNQPPAIPGSTCNYESAEGMMGAEIIALAQQWIRQNRRVYYEGFNSCGEMEFPESLSDQRGPIKIASQVCSPSN